jgi:hypothetical protein
MTMHVSRERWTALRDGISSSLVATISIARGLSLLVSARPKTPLRVLCIMAFDTLHTLRHAKRLPMPRLRVLAALLDFGACANAAFDHKEYCRHEYRTTRRLLEEAGIGPSVVEYLRRLKNLESRRPLAGQLQGGYPEAVRYREAVVRLSLGMLATTADVNHSLDGGIRATFDDADLNILFRIVMQCQIIDDVVDYPQDISAGLPGFLTSSTSLPEALERTRSAALGYADDRGLPRTGAGFPLRSALLLVSACASMMLFLGRCRLQDHLGSQIVERDRTMSSTSSRRSKQRPDHFHGLSPSANALCGRRREAP